MGSIQSSLRLIAVVAAASLVVLTGAVWYFGSAATVAARNEIKAEMATLATLEQLVLEGQKTRRFEKEYFIYVTDAEKATKYAGDVAKSLAVIKSKVKELGSGTKDRALAGALKSWSDAVSFYESEFEAIRARQKRGDLNDPVAANALIKDGKDKFGVFLDQTTSQTKTARERVEAAIVYVESANTRILSVGIGVTLIALCVIAWVVGRTTNTILGEVGRLAEALDHFSKGKLDAIPGLLHLRELTPILAATDRLKRTLAFALERLQKKPAT
jgi:hypothetical protein